MHHSVNGDGSVAGSPIRGGKVQPSTGQDLIENTSGHAPFEFDDTLFGGSYGWYRNETDGTSRRIGAFDILIHSKIIRYNPESLKWDQTLYECQVMWLAPETGKERCSEYFILEPEDLLSKKAFQVQIFKHSYQSARFKSDDEILYFMSFLCNRWQPRTVYEFDYYGFIEHHGFRFYLTRNALITIPKDHQQEPQYIIAPEAGSGMFPMVPADTSFYVKPGRIEPAPMLTLPSPAGGFYPTGEADILTGNQLRYFIDTVREKFGELVAGQQPDKKAEGYLIFAFMCSFLFFDEIYDVFKHVVFLYLYGDPSTGKGQLSQIMLNFFGQSFNDVDSNPTLKSAENKLANHSKIPVIMDEFVPGKGKITPQVFNMWYELRQRGVSASHDRSKNAWSPVRSQLMFISNYKPTEDHFRSRCIMIEYAEDKRGEVHHLWWFDGHKTDMQGLFLSLLFRFNDFNRALFKQELQWTKRLLTEAVEQELQRRSDKEGIRFQVKDRQIENMAALLTVDLFVCRPSDVEFAEFVHQSRGEGQQAGRISDEDLTEMNQLLKEARMAPEIFRYGVEFLANSAEREVQQTPLQQFLASLEVMEENKALPKRYYGWNEAKGELIIYWSGIWDAYTNYNKGREYVSQDAVREEIEAIDINGKAQSHYYNYDDPIAGTQKAVRHGYRIPQHHINGAWLRAFGRRAEANAQSGQAADGDAYTTEEGDAPF
ncbi:hypothetical protein NC796_02185 [Aliifodinibius sp. S!AR15-10]|uniref:hypothetical protein n=1 Tax=Aliifodinibius sp. S!AR15-10 TaxID=2950437 RepID=UPI0028677ED5|nr:hypothetical protein [Aliifodinibius sp. S!AR15-10]MDR8389929.1 hypothetical protein [Aliifodinibius sp. S!AR15-10]